MSNLSPLPPNAEALQLADGSIINTVSYRLPAFDWGEFQLVAAADASDEISQALRQRRWRTPASFRILEDLGKPGRHVLDLGAQIGTFALLAAALGCQVAAVEAEPVNCALLQASVHCNQFANMQVINTTFNDHTDSDHAAPLAVTTVDRLLAQLGWAQVDLVKMALAGSAVQALAGMAQLLQRADAPPILFTANGHTLAQVGETPQQWLAALEDYGYRCYRVEPDALRLTPASAAQWACVTDYLAIKATPHPAHWRFLPPLTVQENIHEARVNAAHPHEHYRAQVGRMLAQAEPAILHERSVIHTLQMLQADPHPAVRAAVAWWNLQEMPLAVRLADRVARLRARK